MTSHTSQDHLPCHRLPLAAALAVCIVGLGTASDTTLLPDPLPLRRVLLPTEKLKAELSRVRDGVLLRMGREEFEALVQQAAEAVKQRRNSPRLVEARYRASLVDAALVGTAEWKVLHHGKSASLLRLSGDGAAFNLAVKKPRYENRDAVLAEFPDPQKPEAGRMLALLVDQPGEHTLTMEWSARAESRPEGLQVELRIPTSPAASLELELPADRPLVVGDGVLASGPHPAESSNRRLWRIACGGKGQISLLIRRPSAGQPAPVVMCWQNRTVQRLSPEGLEATSNFALTALHQDVDTLVCELDPLLRPLEVVTEHLKDYEVKAGTNGGPGTLTIYLSRPVRGAIVKVRSLGPLAPPSAEKEGRPDRPGVLPWTSPALRLLRGKTAAGVEAPAVPEGDRESERGGEVLELWLHPELRLLSWQPGDFRLIDSTVTSDPEKGLPMRRLVLTGGGLASDRVGPRRPGGLIQAGGVEFRARQLSWWRLDSEGMELTSQLDYEVLQGQLFQLTLSLPAGWDPESVELSPPDLLRSWGVGADKTGQLLLIELARPLRVIDSRRGKDEGRRMKDEKKPSEPAASSFLLPPSAFKGGTLNVRLRRPGRWVDRELPFPDLAPVGARFREGGLGVEFDERLYSVAVRSPLSAAEPGATELWGKRIPDYYYPFRGQALAGSLRLQARPPRFRAQVASDVYIAANQAAVTSRLLLEGSSGTPGHIDVYLSANEVKMPDWRVESPGLPVSPRVQRVERMTHLEVSGALALLAARSPLGVASLQAARPPGTFWRLHLNRPLPLRQGVTLRTTWALEARALGRGIDHRRWDVPLPVVLNASRSEGEVKVHLAGVDLTGVDSAGLREGAARVSSGPGRMWRTFRYLDRPGVRPLHTPSSRTCPG